MAKSLFTVYLMSGGVPASKNVLAGPGSTESALQVAVDAALAAVAGAALQSAVQQGGRPIDLTVAAAASPATDGTPKSVWSVQTATGPLLVESWPQTSSGVTESAVDRALQAVSSTPTAISFVGNVDIEV